MEIQETVLLQLSRAKEGDLLLIRSDDMLLDDFQTLCQQLRTFVGNKRVGIILLDSASDLTLVEASEARAILEKIAGNKT